MWKWLVIFEHLVTGERHSVSSAYIEDRVATAEYLKSWMHLNLPKMTEYRLISADVLFTSKKDIDAESNIVQAWPLQKKGDSHEG